MLAASIAGAIALIPGGGATVGAAASALGYLLRCRTCLKVLGVAALLVWTALHVHRADVVRCEARIADEHRQAELARVDRDNGVGADLHKKYQPVIDRLSKENAALQAKVKTNAKSKPAAGAKAPVACKLGDAGLL